MRIAFIAQSRIHVREADGSIHTIESKFGATVRQRAASIERRNAWKSQGSQARLAGMGAALWAHDDDDSTPVILSGIARGRNPGELLYALHTDSVSGIFAVDLATGEEERLFHSAELRVEHIATNPDGVVACTVRSKSGSANIALMSADGSALAVVTEGDSIDVAPRWIPGAPRELVFQSSGIGRNEAGHFAALGQAAVARLEAEKGSLTTIADDPKYDFVGPVVGPDGALYCVRRPYARALERQPNPFRMLLDLLLFPFRIIVALAQYLNFFTMRYTGKPLITSGGARQRQRDVKKLLERGHLIEAKDAATRDAEHEEVGTGSVPSSWELVRVARGESAPTVLARGVAGFDLAEDGTIALFDSKGVWTLSSGERTRLASLSGIEQLVVIA